LYRDTSDNSIIVPERERKFYPNFSGLDLRTARRISSESEIEFEILGNGNVVINQTPKAGTEIRNFARVTLYTDSLETEITMPNCVGINVKDAIDMLLQRGIKPTYVEPGIGRVVRQYPTVGTFWEANSPSSLFVQKEINGL
jgi:beta-lactam-binding protein with PASTA domain